VWNLPLRRPLNSDLVEARIREINDALQTIQALTVKDFSRLGLAEKLALRYLAIQLVEAAASICLHILDARFNERAEGLPDCFTRLGEKGILPRELGEKLGAAARLRNLLVHRYWTIDDSRLYADLKSGLSDFEEFIKEVRRILEEDPDDK